MEVIIMLVLQCYGFEAPVRDSVMWEIEKLGFYPHHTR